MKHVKLIFCVIVCIVVYLIYTYVPTDNIIYLALGDSFALGENPYGEVAYGYSDYLSNYLAENHNLKLYTKKFAATDARIKDVYQDILLNKKVYINGEAIGIKSSLRDSDIITLSIGANDIISQVNIMSEVMVEKKYRDIVNGVGDHLIDLIGEIQKYNKKIILIGYYNLYPKNEQYNLLFKELDKKYQQICADMSITYISLYQDFLYQSYLPNPFNIHPSIEGYEYIYQKIVENIEY